MQPKCEQLLRRAHKEQSKAHTKERAEQEQVERAKKQRRTAFNAMAPMRRTVAREGADAVGTLQHCMGSFVWCKRFTGSSSSKAQKVKVEVEMLQKARHLGVTPVVHSWDEDNMTIIMEYVSNVRVYDLYHTAPSTMIDDDTLRLLKRCVSHSFICAVCGLHKLNVIHGDLHGGNVLIRPHVWSAVLIDFADSPSGTREGDEETARELVQSLCDSLIPETPMQMSHMEETLALRQADLRRVMAAPVPLVAVARARDTK